jgi:hypothetical protein
MKRFASRAIMVYLLSPAGGVWSSRQAVPSSGFSVSGLTSGWFSSGFSLRATI